MDIKIGKMIKKITAHTVIVNKEGLVLGVSRKTNHNDFGLPGGKMDPEDNFDPMMTAIRETKEETGLDVTNLQLIFAIHKGGAMGHTYICEYSGEINHNEPHVVRWLPMEVLMNGSFGRYNSLVAESLTDLKLEFKKDIDIDSLSNELRSFVDSHYNGDIEFSFLRKESNGTYSVNYVDDDGYLEETFGDDKVRDDGFKEIGLKYGVRVHLDSGLYGK